MRALHALLLPALLLTVGSARAASQLLVIGDSLTKEYEITFPGVPLAGVPGIDPNNPAARNWSEILHTRRNNFCDLGIFKSSVFAPWTDLRLLGHEFNWAFPGATSRELRDVLTGQNLSEITANPDLSLLTALAPDWMLSADRITAQLQSGAEAVVILIGGNDVRSGNPDPAASVGGTRISYDTIYSGDGTGAGDPQPLMDSIRSSIQQMATFVRAGNPDIPLVICAVPHVGATPAVQALFPTDPVRTGRITAALDTLNAELKTWTETTVGGAWVDSTYTRTRAMITEPVVVGGVSFLTAADPLPSTATAAAHNRYLFAADGFHPGTALQGLTASAVADALRTRFPATYGSMAPLTIRNVVVAVCELPAATPYLDWLSTSTIPSGQGGLADDPDGDGLTNLVEFALAGLSPTTRDPGALPAPVLDLTGPEPAVTLTWMPRYADNVACEIVCEASPDLTTWLEAPAARLTENEDGSTTARLPLAVGTRGFLRLKVTVTP